MGSGGALPIAVEQLGVACVQVHVIGIQRHGFGHVLQRGHDRTAGHGERDIRPPGKCFRKHGISLEGCGEKADCALRIVLVCAEDGGAKRIIVVIRHAIERLLEFLGRRYWLAAADVIVGFAGK